METCTIINARDMHIAFAPGVAPEPPGLAQDTPGLAPGCPGLALVSLRG